MTLFYMDTIYCFVSFLWSLPSKKDTQQEHLFQTCTNSSGVIKDAKVKFTQFTLMKNKKKKH